MGQLFTEMMPKHIEFIKNQHLFFVGSAPLAEDGHVNLSPKGYDALRILSPTEVAYLDLTGSGNETSGHLVENGRITFMFCAFNGAPLILRLYGKGRVALKGSPEWDQLIGLFDELPGARQIIIAEIYQVQTSCGYGVPLYTYDGDREKLMEWTDKKGDRLEDYQTQKNSKTLDGIETPIGRERRESGV
ncbi:pyridoxamine 5'-phosphate oxidase family protein [Pseudalkalibacillus berkeleyi]|uniref:Pyridoxamine 5'-phosphate oxidase family protein n=1 Tax=Pseudalkalibacillus berkeleyi TaxID=1069813 RepID=A0ABS9GYE2_9BACL|nr:pyridoxamine 5'-phosphate oxidase family protein [Pseudalkalibacillus berkeleyi]MCF6136664.1 pyridoxamine 5'-phosphate oxidase family protein [Pseudalkalibacillus berkeleyi]